MPTKSAGQQVMANAQTIEEMAVTSGVVQPHGATRITYEAATEGVRRPEGTYFSREDQDRFINQGTPLIVTGVNGPTEGTGFQGKLRNYWVVHCYELEDVESEGMLSFDCSPGRDAEFQRQKELFASARGELEIGPVALQLVRLRNGNRFKQLVSLTG